MNDITDSLRFLATTTVGTRGSRLALQASDEIERLRAELAELKARSCAGCDNYLHGDGRPFGSCCYFVTGKPIDFYCSKWEPKT